MRALASKATAYDTMTLESCEADCAGYTYFGTEYSRECKQPTTHFPKLFLTNFQAIVGTASPQAPYPRQKPIAICYAMGIPLKLVEVPSAYRYFK